MNFMRMLMMVGVLALVAACTPPATQEAEHMSAGCDARATAPWQAGDAAFSVEATATGPDCARAVATIRNLDRRFRHTLVIRSTPIIVIDGVVASPDHFDAGPCSDR